MEIKIAFLIIVVSVSNLLAIDTYSQVVKVSLDMENQTLEQVMNEIEKQSEFYFIFNQKQIDVHRMVDIQVENKLITDILPELFEGTSVNYAVLDRKIFLTTDVIGNDLQTIGSNFHLLQQTTVTGTVTDASTGDPVPGVTIQVKGTNTGTFSQANGTYNIIVPQNSNTLIFSFVGYLRQEINIEGRSVINVILVSEVTVLDELVVVGYGIQKKSVVTGAISSITDDDLLNNSYARADQAIQGKSAGVQVINTSGSPGSQMKIRIRGYSSNGKADPLYIVDGVKTNDINSLDPNDIASMEILKDAASSAIYGAEGGNGVIIITTKSGKSGISTLNYEFQYALQSIGKRPGVLNAKEFATYYNEGGVTNIDLDNIKYDVDHLKEITEVAPLMKHYISFSDGTEKSTFLLTASVLDQEGIVIGDRDRFKRYTFRLNADNQMTKWLKVGNNTSFAYTHRNSLIEDNERIGLILSALKFDPLTPVYYEDDAIPANIQAMINAGQPLVKNKDGHYYGISDYISKSPCSPYVSLAVDNSSGEKSYRVQGQLFAEITPIKNLVFTSRLGYDIYNSRSTSWTPIYYYKYTFHAEVPIVSENFSSSRYLMWENFANYNNTFGSHSINALVGISAEDINSEINFASGGPMIIESDNFAHLDYISSQSLSTVSGSPIRDKKASYFGRLAYDYKSKYLFMATARYDGAGTSLLPKENSWGFFPSFSLGWVFSEEAFFPEILKFIDFGKIRFSWGENGSLSNLRDYMYMSSITSTGMLYQLGDGTYYSVSVPNRLHNPDLRWETSIQTDLGLDLRMFKDRLTMTVDYFDKKTTDLITPNTPPLESGNTPPAVNGGDILNRGVELDLQFKHSLGELNYVVRGNVSILHNEVTYLNPNIQRIDGGASTGGGFYMTAFEKGMPVWYFRGYKTDGINETTGKANFIDTNNDGIINDEDKTFIGSSIPKYNFGAGFNLSYKGFDLVMNLYGQAGAEVFNLWVNTSHPGGNIPRFWYDGRWTPDNPTNASMPKAVMDKNDITSDLVVFSSDFVRIKQMQLGYSLPQSLISKINMRNIRLYISLEDYFTFSKYPGMDPAAGSTVDSNLGIDRGMYPITKKALFGLSISF